MTRLPATPVPPPAPASVILSELALAAGAAGHGVTVCFDGYAAPLLCDVWKRFIARLGSSRVFHVSTQADVRKLGEVANLRLIIVHQARLLSPTAWAIQMATPAESPFSRPAVFCRFAPQDPEDDPGATLVLRANTHEAALLRQWITTGTLSRIGLAEPDLSEPVVTASELMPLFSHSRPIHGDGMIRFREQKILRGLLVGATVLRAAQQEGRLDMPLIATLQDYELVRTALQSEVVSPADMSCDPLAVDMVNRANVYLAAKWHSYDDFLAPSGSDDPAYESAGERPPRELITRREIADLGNLGSRVLRRLVASVVGRQDGYEHFTRLGLVRHPPARDHWSAETPERLTRLLRSWTAKQVRLHFGKLHREGMISAERRQANGPRYYQLPEELINRSSGFRGLPTAAQLASAGRHA